MRMSGRCALRWCEPMARANDSPLIEGISKPYAMDLDGKNKRDGWGKGGGFAYGAAVSSDGKSICYHESYRITVSDADGKNKKRIETGHAFDFAPSWSPDGKWLLFVSGEHYDCHPHIVRPDGTGLKTLADRNGYRGVIEFLDALDFHGGSSDTPSWSVDGRSVFSTAAVGESVELHQTALDGQSTRLTTSPKARSTTTRRLRRTARTWRTATGVTAFATYMR